MGFVCSCNSGLNGFGQEVSSAQKTCSVDWEGVYRSLEGDVEQLLKISVSRDIMSFSYAIVTNNDSLCFSLAGRAILKIGDLEWDEDDEGVAYPVDEYVYDSACYMAIRIFGRRFFLLVGAGHGIVRYPAVQQTDDAGGVF